MPMHMPPQGNYHPLQPVGGAPSNKTFLWIVLALIVLGAGVGISLAFLL